MRILYVNHTGSVSGAERSLLDLLRGLRGEEMIRLACPAEGPLAGAALELGVPVDAISGMDGSLKLHPRETPRALGGLTVASAQIGRHAYRMRADVIHANSIRAGLMAVPAAKATRKPAVVHVRDRLPRSRAADTSLQLIARGARVVVANSQYSADGVRAATQRGRVRVVYNPVDLERFNRGGAAPTTGRERLGLPRDALVVAVIGQITPWKGQLEAVQILAHLGRMGRDAYLLLVGEPKFVSAATRYDNRAYFAMLKRTIAQEGLSDRVRLLGERSDIPDLMSSLDALLVPSWEEPFGRVVIEAMALGLVVFATTVGGPAEIIHDEVDGRLLVTGDAAQWATAITAVLDRPDRRSDLETAARVRAADFALPKHVAAMRGIYEEALRA